MTVQDDNSNGESTETDITDNALGPWKPKMVNELLEVYRIDYAAWIVIVSRYYLRPIPTLASLILLTYARRRGDYSNSHCSALREQRGDDGDTGDKYQATSQTNTDPLCQKHLPVSSAEAQGHRT